MGVSFFLFQIDTAAHNDECHGVVGHSTEKEEYHEFERYHTQKEFDFDEDGTVFVSTITKTCLF